MTTENDSNENDRGSLNVSNAPQEEHVHHYRYQNSHSNYYDSPVSSPSSTAASQSSNVYIRGLSPEFTDEDLLELCSKFGKVVSSKAILEKSTFLCKGYGFAMYETHEETKEALEGLRQYGYTVSLARESFSTKLRYLQDTSSTNVYVSNLPAPFDENSLAEFFSPHEVTSTRILRDYNGNSSGVGFARFRNRDSALQVIAKYNEIWIEGSEAPLQVRFADSTEQKRLKRRVCRSKRAEEEGGFIPSVPSPLSDNYGGVGMIMMAPLCYGTGEITPQSLKADDKGLPRNPSIAGSDVITPEDDSTTEFQKNNGTEESTVPIAEEQEKLIQYDNPNFMTGMPTYPTFGLQGGQQAFYYYIPVSHPGIPGPCYMLAYPTPTFFPPKEDINNGGPKEYMSDNSSYSTRRRSSYQESPESVVCEDNGDTTQLASQFQHQLTMNDSSQPRGKLGMPPAPFPPYYYPDHAFFATTPTASPNASFPSYPSFSPPSPAPYPRRDKSSRYNNRYRRKPRY